MSNRPSECWRTLTAVRDRAPGRLSPTSSRKSRWQAMKLTIGAGLFAASASTSLTTLEPSRLTKATSPMRDASHRTSSSRKSTTAS